MTTPTQPNEDAFQKQGLAQFQTMVLGLQKYYDREEARSAKKARTSNRPVKNACRAIFTSVFDIKKAILRASEFVIHRTSEITSTNTQEKELT